MRTIVEIILHNSEEAYKEEYVKCFVNNSQYQLWGVPVSFDEKSFEHIFYEPENDSSKKGQFSKRRAKKMFFIKAILDNKVSFEVMDQPDRGTFAVFCEELDCVMYVRNRVGKKVLQIGSFFDFGKDHTKMMNKRKRTCVSITQEEFLRKIK